MLQVVSKEFLLRTDPAPSEEKFELLSAPESKFVAEPAESAAIWPQPGHGAPSSTVIFMPQFSQTKLEVTGIVCSGAF